MSDEIDNIFRSYILQIVLKTYYSKTDQELTDYTIKQATKLLSEVHKVILEDIIQELKLEFGDQVEFIWSLQNIKVYWDNCDLFLASRVFIDNDGSESLKQNGISLGGYLIKEHIINEFSNQLDEMELRRFYLPLWKDKPLEEKLQVLEKCKKVLGL